METWILMSLTLRKSYAIPAIFLAMLLFNFTVPAMAAGEGISTNKSNIKANVPIDFDATGLTVSTYYTIYTESAIKGNKSTSATATTLEFTLVVDDTYLDTWVTVSLKDAAGTTTLATLEIECVAVIPQYTIDMVGAFIPLLMVFAVVFGLMGGIAMLVLKLVR
jgi:hypothetical protein